MTSTAILRTPPASNPFHSDYISLRPPRDKGTVPRHENTPSPTAPILGHRFKSPPDCSLGDSPSQPSPSPLRKRILFERGANGQRDSDDDEETSPSVSRLHSPFVTRCASPFLAAWGSLGPKHPLSTQPIEDDEGLFLASKATKTPLHTSPQPSLSQSENCIAETTSRTPSFPKLILTPSAAKTQQFPALSPLPGPRFGSRTPHTPAETEWHLGKQAESMTKLSLGDDYEQLGCYGTKGKPVTAHEEELSPLLVPKRRGRKRSFDGKELPRSWGGIFEATGDTPVTESFRIPESPSPATRLKCSATTFFGPPIMSPSAPSSKAPSHLTVTTKIARSRSSSPNPTQGPIAKKYRPRDSGVGGLEDDDETDDRLGPLASASNAEVPSLNEEDTGLVTPGCEPPNHSAWPRAVFAEARQSDVDEFIFKTLATGGAPPKDKKVIPGTPVKRNAFMHSRPWMSSSKVMPPPVMPPHGDVIAPRKSLPLSFPNLSQIQDSPDDSNSSPSDRTFTQKKIYGDVGKGRPVILTSKGGGEMPVSAGKRFLSRRSSSSTFSTSSSSEGSILGTPTKGGVHESQTTLTSRPSLSLIAPTPGHSIKRPPLHRYNTFEHHYRSSPRPLPAPSQRPLTEHERLGKFETDFATVDNLGTGEFGNVLKVRYKHGNGNDVFAIKKSKRFEGVKHRRRLREEVDVLKHLALIGGPHRTSDVLKYIDSWEQDDVLYIQTELCELGNFATFLAEYGAHFEALDEARVWKICAELSNGLKFIHAAGVIHLDLKPANIFVTGEGRFKIGDFGMASFWPRCIGGEGFEREGDREYMAPEILQGRYGKEADVFSFGMIILETATNIIVPDMGDDWHRLREDDFSAVDFSAAEGSSVARPRSMELVELIQHMMRADPDARLTTEAVFEHPVVRRAGEAMACKRIAAIENGTPVFGASPLGGEPEGYINEVLRLGPITPINAMDLTP